MIPPPIRGCVAVAVTALAAVAAVASSAWDIAFVDGPAMPGHMNERSLRLDSAGRPHLVYGDYLLRYAWLDGEAWRIETVPGTAGIGGDMPSLGLDAGDRPHVTYYDKLNRDLIYAWKAADGWHSEPVDTAGDVGSVSSLVLDSAGNPRVAYYDAPPAGDLKYAFRDGSGWHREIVDSQRDVGRYLSLCLNISGEPAIAYHDRDRWDLKYAVRSTAGWQTAAFARGFDVSLAMDSAGRPHAAYYLWPGFDLLYAFLDSVGWHIEIVDAPGAVGSFPSLRLDGEGRPHVSYFDETRQDLKYAWKDGSAWQIVRVAEENSMGRYATLDLLMGRPHVACYDETGAAIIHACSDEAGWRLSYVERRRVACDYPSLAIDADGFPHVAYYDSTFGDLMHGFEDASGWHAETVDRRGDTGQWTSIETDSQGRLAIAYAGKYEGSWGHLRYAWKDDAGWHIETVHEDICASNVSLAFDAADEPHVSFYSHRYGKGYYARRSVTWQVEPAPTDSSTGSLRIDRWGLPHLAAGSNGLVHAFHDGFAWHQEIPSPPISASRCVLELDSSDNPRIASIHGGNGRPYYHSVETGQWQGASIDSVNAFALSLALWNDHPSLAYYDYWPTMNLRYATREGTQWRIEVVDDAWDVGAAACIRVSPGGRPYIAYVDQTSRALKLARGEASLSIEADPRPLPMARILRVSPSPVRTTATIRLSSQVDGAGELAVFDVAGRRVQTVARSTLRSGTDVLSWSPAGIPSGHYYLRLTVNGLPCEVIPIVVVR